MSTQAASAKPSAVSRALARDRLGVPAVLAFILAGVAPLTVAAGLIPTAYGVTGLTAIPAAFLVVAVILAVFATGYTAMSRSIVNAGAFYAFIAQGLGRAAGVAAALIALLAYSCLQIALYGMLGPAAASQAAAHLGVHAAWWAWALGAWAVVAVLGLIGVVYAGSAWAMAAHAGDAHVVAAANAQGPALMFGLGGSVLSQAAQWLFLTSLFAAALAFHNAVWRYAFALGREGVLPGRFGRTGSNNIPKAASLAQSASGLAVIGAFALAGWPPMTGLFFGGGTTGGFGILLLLAVTSVAVIVFFARNPRGESAWSRLIAPALAAIVLTGLAVLAVMHYGTLLGVPPGAAAAWALPASYAVLAVAGLAWGLVIKIRRPAVYDAIGLGAHAASFHAAAAGSGARR